MKRNIFCMNKKKIKKKIIFIFIECLLISCISGCNKVSIEQRIGVSVNKYSRHQVRQALQFSGTVESRNEEVVITSSTAKIKDIKVKIGERINKGEVICTLDTTEWEKKKKRIKENVVKEKKKYDIQIAKYQKEIENEKRKKNRKIVSIKQSINEKKQVYYKYKSNLNKVQQKKNDNSYEDRSLVAYENMVNAKQKYEIAKIEYENIVIEENEKINSLEYDLKCYRMDNGYFIAKKEYVEICDLIQNANIVANVSGIISEVYVQERVPCLDGMIAKIVDNNDKIVRISGSERQFLSIQEGMSAFTYLYGMEEKEYKGSVEKILKLIEDSMFTAYVSLPQDTELIVGMNVDVTVEIMNLKDIYAVEASAVYENKDGVTCVLIAEKDNVGQYVAIEKIVKIKEKSEEYMILEDGQLREGDLVIQNIDMCSNGDIVHISDD